MRIWLKNALRTVVYGWKDAGMISTMPDVDSGRISVYIDILGCFLKYRVISSQYRENKLYSISEDERKRIGANLKDLNSKKDYWEQVYYQNWRFLKRYSSLKYETSSLKHYLRNQAYSRRFGLGKNCSVQYGVMFICEHGFVGRLTVGNNVLFARDVDIDYTGDVIIGDNVRISESVKILSHNHPLDKKEYIKITPITICEGVGFGARAVVLPGVESIGRGAYVSAGAVVKRSVPPYAVVMGNPARIVGFRMIPEEIIEYEKEHYSENERIPLELLEANYKKFFLSRIKEIQQFLI